MAGAGMRRQEGPAVFLRHSFRAAGAVPGGDGLAAGRRQEGDVLLPGGGHRAEVYAQGGVRATEPESGVPSAPRRAASRAMAWLLTAVRKGDALLPGGARAPWARSLPKRRLTAGRDSGREFLFALSY